MAKFKEIKINIEVAPEVILRKMMNTTAPINTSQTTTCDVKNGSKPDK